MTWSGYRTLVEQIADLRREAVDVFQQVVLPHRETVGYSQTL